MALGGGVFTLQNKTLPGAYINFINSSRGGAEFSARGKVAVALPLDFFPAEKVVTVSAGEFQKDSLKLFGLPYDAVQLKGLRDLFLNASTCYIYNLKTGGTKASNDLAEALYSGVRGNAITVIISLNTASTDIKKVYDVKTAVDGITVDTQTVEKAATLVPNSFVSFKSAATLAVTVGTPLIGGVDGTVIGATHANFLSAIESYNFNILACTATEDTVKALYVAFTKRLRDEIGIKLQCVLHKYEVADSEGVISVENNVQPDLVYWVSGAMAGCPINRSNTNKIYNGEFDVDTNYTNLQLEDAIKAGKLMFHKVGDTARLLTDINTLKTLENGKGDDFKSNQTIRVLDQIGNDLAAMFNTKYLGLMPNNNAGRLSLWNDIVKHHQGLLEIAAIEDFLPDNIIVEAGSDKKSVVITDTVTPTNAMEKLYMTVIIK